jgi:hypothetical protein
MTHQGGMPCRRRLSLKEQEQLPAQPVKPDAMFDRREAGTELSTLQGSMGAASVLLGSAVWLVCMWLGQVSACFECWVTATWFIQSCASPSRFLLCSVCA